MVLELFVHFMMIIIYFILYLTPKSYTVNNSSNGSREEDAKEILTGAEVKMGRDRCFPGVILQTCARCRESHSPGAFFSRESLGKGGEKPYD